MPHHSPQVSADGAAVEAANEEYAKQMGAPLGDRELCRAVLQAALPHLRTEQGEEERASEARGELATALGFLRLNGRFDDGVERRLEAALDRLDRLTQGEDYIERWEDLNRRTKGAAHFTPPHPDALPAALHKDTEERCERCGGSRRLREERSNGIHRVIGSRPCPDCTPRDTEEGS